ncbi:hypothetical protein I7I51_08955 [Histoplasma capsulatum]|uniref:Uncharacterized protein n=1 Tax=Ajellomyces capsulatus TaxID=5037 RepID=A0A8A1M2E2_AJECA|nr:hypothetical protein I7I51_08955 [Histoplasma capsulatum]
MDNDIETLAYLKISARGQTILLMRVSVSSRPYLYQQLPRPSQGKDGEPKHVWLNERYHISCLGHKTWAKAPIELLIERLVFKKIEKRQSTEKMMCHSLDPEQLGAKRSAGVLGVGTNHEANEALGDKAHSVTGGETA